MSRQRISSGSTFEEKIAYSRAIVHGDWVFVAGTTGFDYSKMTIADDIYTQTDQCLKNIQAALAQAGASLADVVRVNYVVPEASEFELCWPIKLDWIKKVQHDHIVCTFLYRSTTR